MTPTFQRSILCTFCLFCVLFIIMCDTQPIPIKDPYPTSINNETKEEKQGFFLQKETSVSYHFRWDWQDAAWDHVFQGYRFQNNATNSLGLQRGYLSTIAVQMVPCQPKESLNEKKTFGFHFPSLPIQFGFRHAWGNHFYKNDPSQVTRKMIEPIHKEATTLFGKGLTGEMTYCSVHLLHTALTKKATDNAMIENKSFSMQGEYSTTRKENVQFHASTPLMSGTLLPIEYASKDIEPPIFKTQIALLIVRSPVKAFLNIDPHQLSDLEFAFKILQNIGIHSRAYLFTDKTP